MGSWMGGCIVDIWLGGWIGEWVGGQVDGWVQGGDRQRKTGRIMGGWMGR